MRKHIEEYTLNELIKRRDVLFKALEWAISNRDKELTFLCERELAMVLKRIKRLRG